MPHGRDRRSAKQARRAKRRSQRPQRQAVPVDDAPLLGEVRQALADQDPARLLGFVSMLMEISDPRRVNPFGAPEASAVPPRPELVGTFIDVVCPETTALLAGFAELIGDDEMLRARIRHELADRSTPPGAGWIDRFAQVEVYRAVAMTHVLGDGENVILGVRLAGGEEFTCSVYIDHNLGTLVKDAMVISEPMTTVVAKYKELTDDPDARWDDIALADARVRIEEAVALAAMTYPPFETDSWPGCRALVEWVVRAMPSGGAGYRRKEWDEADAAELAARFFGSRYGTSLDNPTHRDLLESMLWYAIDFGAGDPMRWSAVRVELLLIDWIPRKIISAADFLASAPDLLKAFIEFAHSEFGIRAELTAEALAAVDHHAPKYQRIIRSPRPQGPEALLAALGLDVDGFDDDDMDPDDIVVWDLARQVGGRAELENLDENPLPDEPFRWSGIAEDVTARVREVLDLVDGCCDAILDVEYRTACRRFLAPSGSASKDPSGSGTQMSDKNVILCGDG